jgi:hypothetical protein
LAIKLKKSPHSRDPLCWDGLPENTSAMKLFDSPLRRPRDYARRDPRDSGAIKNRNEYGVCASSVLGRALAGRTGKPSSRLWREGVGRRA